MKQVLTEGEELSDAARDVFIEISPDILRLIADKMDHEAKRASPNEQITHQITDGIILFYDKETDRVRK